MKRILTICLIVVVAIAAISCGNIYKKESLPKYDIGVIKTSQYKKESIIYLYDKNFKKINEIKIPYSGVTDVFDTAYIYKNNSTVGLEEC